MGTLDSFSLKGKVAVVTGATGLIGREHCRALAEAGARVVAVDIQEAAVKDFAGTLGGGAVGHKLDVTNEASVETLKAFLAKEMGGLDILVNNAAINEQFENPIQARELSKFDSFPLEVFRKMLEVNVLGVFLCAQRLGALMVEKKQGSIINVASTYGVVAPDQKLYVNPQGEQAFYKSPAYPTTKAAVAHFTRYLARHWGPHGVRVNTLSPGGVENSQDGWFVENYSAKTPLGRMAKPTDYKGALVFLASDASAYMTGANLLVDGGFCA